MSNKVVFYAPHARLWNHAYPEALMGEALQSQGFDVHFITCDRALNAFCVAMEAAGVSELASAEEKEAVCKKCIQNKRVIHGHVSLERSELNSYLTPADDQEIDRILAEVAPETLVDFQIDEIPVGRASLYNYCLKMKKFFDRVFTPEEWAQFRHHFRSCLVSFFAGRAILAQHRPDYMIFYSSPYSINLVVRLQAEKLGVKTFSIFSGLNWSHRLQEMHVSSVDNFQGFAVRGELWEQRFRSLPATRRDLESAWTFLETIVRGSSPLIYGGGRQQVSRRDMLERWGITPDQKVLFLATSSSDELYSGQAIGAIPMTFPSAFDSQLHWIESTIDHVRTRPDLFLVVRVHPRELPNRRDNLVSEHARQLQALLQDLPPNVRVNWPSDNLSINDWLEVIDVGLTSWSSAGKELALWGIPNVSYMAFNLYPKEELGYLALTPEDYYQAIDRAIAEGWSERRVLQAYRWLAYELEGAVFDLSDALPNDKIQNRPLSRKVFDKLTGYRFENQRYFKFHQGPLKQAALIAERIRTGTPTELVLEPTRNRLSVEEEELAIRDVVQRAATLLLGPDWENDRTGSALRENLHRMVHRAAQLQAVP